MSSRDGESTVRQKFSIIVKNFNAIETSPERQDSERYQKLVHGTLQQLNTLQRIVGNLNLFSANEHLNEVNPSYLPFATLPYYESVLYQKLLTDSSGAFSSESLDRVLFKPMNLRKAKAKLLEFLTQLDSFHDVLSSEQSNVLNSFKKSYDPSNEEIIAAGGDATSRRSTKIANYKIEKELRGKLATLDDFYTRYGHPYEDGGEEDILQTMDEEAVRLLYVDQLKLFSLYGFRDLELIAMELQVLKNNENGDSLAKNDNRQQAKPRPDTFAYNPKVEADPTKHKDISDLISKSGKILQPFVITSNKQKLRRDVFGTGQVLPSMSVEEYLDYELANGKMASSGPQEGTSGGSDEETTDSDEELRKREWDDWKDDNPKGSGNMKANIG